MAGPNPNDEIRRVMLRYFYERNAAATSKRGKRGSGVKVSDVKKELKIRHGLTQQQVMSNLTYLLDRGWVKEDEVKKEFKQELAGAIPQLWCPPSASLRLRMSVTAAR